MDLSALLANPVLTGIFGGSLAVSALYAFTLRRALKAQAKRIDNLEAQIVDQDDYMSGRLDALESENDQCFEDAISLAERQSYLEERMDARAVSVELPALSREDERLN